MAGLKGEAFTQEDRDQMDWDEYSEGLMEGRYDVQCSTCKGENVIDEADLSKLTKDQQNDYEFYQDECAAEDRQAAWELKYCV